MFFLPAVLPPIPQDVCHLFSFLPFFLGGVRRLNRLVDELVEPFDDITAHLFKSVRIHHMVGDAAHHIFTVLALRVHHRDRFNDLHSCEIAKISRHGGGSDINRETVTGFELARPYADDFLIHPDTDGDLPFALSQGRRYLPQRL